MGRSANVALRRLPGVCNLGARGVGQATEDHQRIHRTTARICNTDCRAQGLGALLDP